MLVETVSNPSDENPLGTRELRLNHISRRTPEGTILICFSRSGRLPQSLKQKGLRSGDYCVLTHWKVRYCMVGMIPIDLAELQYFYAADAYRRWVDRTHQALVKACHYALKIARRV